MSWVRNVDFDFAKLQWHINLPTEGQAVPVQELDWAFELGGGEFLSDPKYSQLLFELQSFLRISITESLAGSPLSLGSAWHMFAGLREIARYMWWRGFSTVESIDSAASWEYVEYLRDNYLKSPSYEKSADRHRPRKLTFASAYRSLRPLSKMNELQIELRRAGLPTLPEAPYSGMATFGVVTSHLGLEQADMQLPIPDEVSIPVLSRAAVWVMEGAGDVIRLQSLVLGLLEGVDGVGAKRRAQAEATQAIEEFEFSVRKDTGLSWHSPVERQERMTYRGRARNVTVIEEFRHLVSGMVAACIITIQGSTGMRAHELIGLRVNRDEPGDLSCLERTESSDGLMEVFALKGITAKRHVSEHKWSAGLRPIGSRSMPVAVEAAYVLEELLRPWRDMIQDDHLLLAPGIGRGLPIGPKAMVPFRNANLTLVQREFAADALVEAGYSWDEAVELAGEVKGARWRTTFAQAVFRTSPRLIGALRDHYKHVSDLVTDQGYIGNDAALLEDLEGERVQATARTLLEIAMGTRVGAGPAQRLVAEHRAQIKIGIEGMPGSTALERAEAYVKLNDVRIWTGPYANCLINVYPSRSRCNAYAASVPGFAMPDYANRSPAVCATCGCGVIMSEHLEFWKARHDENMRIMEEEDRSAFAARHSIARRRAAQSQAVLRVLRSKVAVKNRSGAGVV